ncbi:MAG: hypothetical protein L6R40_001838 [Gallowayella cf. fulva]|nr:MAG: hypothetical protein L6R40_001838 [Xanthomendoza cf. fulva]
MHILVTNDDGPPSNQSSPYIHSFVKTLQTAGHTVSVIVPHQQRSWIGKAHFAAQVIKPTYFRPGSLHQDDGTTHAKPLQSDLDEEWVLVDSTPATAAQLGLFHFFQDRGPVDLVISGPNYGRNTTSVFSLSSGTIGGAMEAAVCRKRAIALSYAFFSRNHDPDIIAAASRMSVKLVEHLMNHWDEGVDLYSVNVPLIAGVEGKKAIYTYALQNYWQTGSSFTEIEAKDEEDADPEEKEMAIREQEGKRDGGDGNEKKRGHQHRHFTWTPNFSDVYHSVETSEPGNDGWAVKEGLVSVTPLKANFMHVPGLQGELKLSPTPSSKQPSFYALIDYEDTYTHPIILDALSALLPRGSYTLISSLHDLPSPDSPFLQVSSYESLPFQHLLDHPSTSLVNSYVIRKALIRKHYLAHTIHSYLVKNPSSDLKDHVPVTVDFELDYAEFLDEALLEAYELHEAFARNQGKSASEREWWILKPGMSDRGQGIRLFSTEQELHTIFQQWEDDQPSSSSSSSSASTSDSDEVDNNGKPQPSTSPSPISSSPLTTTTLSKPSSDGIVTSQLRHFIAQPYIAPLLLPQCNNRKFHLRTYVLCIGALRVYVYNESLALFADPPYRAPGTQTETQTEGEEEPREIDLRPHLTNTCLLPRPQTPPSSSPLNNSLHNPSPQQKSIIPLSLLPLPLPSLTSLQTQIQTTTHTLFLAAATQNPTTFQPLPNAFEVFGLDFLVDARSTVWLLEVNAFPDFGQSGSVDEGRRVVEGFWRGVVGCVLCGESGFFGGRGGGGEEGNGNDDERKEVEGTEKEKEKEKGLWEMIKVLDLDMGKR